MLLIKPLFDSSILDIYRPRPVISNPGPGELQGLLVFVVILHIIN